MCELTVIMPVYNGEQFLSASIESILNQTFKEFTLLVLDDHSTDTTANILNRFQQQDSRIKVITKPTNVGPANLRNEGIEIADTEFIALMDADDIAQSTRFEKQITLLKKHPEIGVCGTWFTFFGDKKNKCIKHATNHEVMKVQFLKNCCIGNPTVMFRKSVLGTLRFEPKYVPAEDYGLWSQLIAHTKFCNLPESLLQYRWHPHNISQTKSENLRKSEVLIRTKQLEQLGIQSSDKELDYFINAVSLKRKQSLEAIIKTIRAANKLKALNKKHGYYNQKVFENHINSTIVRSIRNAKNYNMAFYTFVKNESGYFKHLPLIDRLFLYTKCLF